MDSQTNVILGAAGFLEAGSVLLEFTGVALGGGAIVVTGDAEEAGVTVGVVGLPDAVVVMVGAEFTSTGSVDGMGFPSLL